MTTVLVGLALALLAWGAVQLIVAWRSRREDRRAQLLRESWAIYRASRAIHDETLRALQAMLDEARARKDAH